MPRPDVHAWWMAETIVSKPLLKSIQSSSRALFLWSSREYSWMSWAISRLSQPRSSLYRSSSTLTRRSFPTTCTEVSDTAFIQVRVGPSFPRAILFRPPASDMLIGCLSISFSFMVGSWTSSEFGNLCSDQTTNKTVDDPTCGAQGALLSQLQKSIERTSTRLVLAISRLNLDFFRAGFFIFFGAHLVVSWWLITNLNLYVSHFEVEKRFDIESLRITTPRRSTSNLSVVGSWWSSCRIAGSRPSDTALPIVSFLENTRSELGLVREIFDLSQDIYGLGKPCIFMLILFALKRVAYSAPLPFCFVTFTVGNDWNQYLLQNESVLTEWGSEKIHPFLMTSRLSIWYLFRYGLFFIPLGIELVIGVTLAVYIVRGIMSTQVQISALHAIEIIMILT